MKFESFPKRLQRWAGSALDAPDAFGRGGRFSWVVLCFLLAGCLIWQVMTYRYADIDPEVGLKSASGVHDQRLFSYGLFYWKKFPVFPDRGMLPRKFRQDDYFYSREGAADILGNFGFSLKMESRHTMLYGELGKNYLPFFHAVLKGRPQNLSFRPANAVVFVLALLLLLAAGWWIRRGFAAVFLVLLIGSYPFQLFETYRHDNVFSYTITTSLWMAALCLPFLFSRKLKPVLQFALAVAIGLSFALLHTVRSEPLALLAGVIFALLLYKPASFLRRLLLVGMILFSLVVGDWTTGRLFEKSFRDASRFVAMNGGTVFKGRRAQHHVFWHSIYIGLGDFDDKHGIAWEDGLTFRFVIPELKKKYGAEQLPEQYGTKDGYENPIFLHPDYGRIVRDKFFSHIKEDPGWYASILWKRAVRIIDDAVRSRIHIAGLSFPFFWLAVPGIFLMGLAVLARRWAYLKLAVFAFPTAAVALFVYSEGGMTHYFVGHLFFVAAALSILLKFGIYAAVRSRTESAGEGRMIEIERE